VPILEALSETLRYQLVAANDGHQTLSAVTITGLLVADHDFFDGGLGGHGEIVIGQRIEDGCYLR